jgi:hypothetical protein
MKEFLRVTGIVRIFIFLYRAKIALKQMYQSNGLLTKWLFSSNETTNFTYHLYSVNQKHLINFIANISKQPYSAIEGYISEILNDKDLASHLLEMAKKGKDWYKTDRKVRFGRRIGWYAFIRATKPKVVIETGVDKGLGSCVIASALLRNRAEGFDGHYYGTDIDPRAGYLLAGKYAQAGKILYGDSIESLKKLDEKIDLFINDSDHSVVYEAQEYETVASKLSPSSIILGDNSHCSDSLLNFAHKTGRKFEFFKEVPDNHWYSGAGIGCAYFDK